MRKKSIEDIMSKNIISVFPSDTAQDAACLMKDNNIGALPVVSGGVLQGIITDRDIIIRCIARGEAANKIKVSDIMTGEVACVSPSHTVSDAANIMAVEQIRRLPVITDGQLDGMVSFADIARLSGFPEVAMAISEISKTNLGPCNAVKTK